MLDKYCGKHYDKDYMKKAEKKRSTGGYPTERTVHWLEDGLGDVVWKVASEPGPEIQRVGDHV